MNEAGLAVGVNMLPSRLCDPGGPGSIPCSSSGTASSAAARSRRPSRGSGRRRAAYRGCTPWRTRTARPAWWKRDAGSPGTSRFPSFDHIPSFYRDRLPGLPYIQRIRAAHGEPQPSDGLFVRGRDYCYPEEYLRDWNEGLWKAFDRNWLAILKDLLGDIVGGSKRPSLESVAEGGPQAPGGNCLFACDVR